MFITRRIEKWELAPNVDLDADALLSPLLNHLRVQLCKIAES
jgi:hypothetical protein